MTENRDPLTQAEDAELAARRRRMAGDAEDAPGMVSALADADERVIESALRPRRLTEFTGQARVREQLSLILQSALRRGRPPDHVLLSGPPGLGKTTIAMIVAAELGAPLRITSGPAIERSGDLAAILSTLSEGEVIFIDEIHRLARPAEEMLYLAMEDFRVDVVIGKGPGATAIPLEIAPFTLVGATTRAGLLPAPLRDRFGFTAHLDFYAPDELEHIIRRSAGLLGVTLTDEGATELSTRSRGTPRIANRLLRRVRDYAEVRADGVVTREIARTALEIYEVDSLGLDRLDRGVLEAVVRRFGGGPVGLSTLAVALGEEAETVEVVAEPFLVRCGLLARTPRGRVATAAGWAHLGLTPPPSLAESPTLFDLVPGGKIAPRSRSLAKPRSLLVHGQSAAKLRQLVVVPLPRPCMQNQLEGCPGHGEFHSGRRGDLNQVTQQFLYVPALDRAGFRRLLLPDDPAAAAPPAAGPAAAAHPHSRRQVRTTAGMYATVSAVDGDDVILEVAPGVDVRYMRKAIMQIISEGEPEETETVSDAHDEEYADDDVAEDDADLTDVHDDTESAPDGLADSHDGDRVKSD